MYDDETSLYAEEDKKCHVSTCSINRFEVYDFGRRERKCFEYVFCLVGNRELLVFANQFFDFRHQVGDSEGLGNHVVLGKHSD
jgi:hypothetical protein